MITKNNRFLRFSAFLSALVILSGCASKQKILEGVAKDWCETIRASQVIPVYPLTEDIQPGDVFLVQTTVDKQQSEYKKKGFLPLDNHIYRLDLTGYSDFYDHSFDTGRLSVFPVAWQRPKDGVDSWGPAPHAAFPTYSFSVSSGAGLNLAIPVSGVPVGLSLMGSKSANGSISIENARTLGVDLLSAYKDLQAWAATNRSFLQAYGGGSNNRTAQEKPINTKNNYLRVVTRIYVTGKLTVALSDTSNVAGGVDVGVPRPVDLILTQPSADGKNVNKTTLDSYTKNLAALNAMLAESFKPSRVSGSNEGLNPDSTDAKTKAKFEAYVAETKRLQNELAKQQAAVDNAKKVLAAAGEDAKAAAQSALAKSEGLLEITQSSLATIGKLMPGGSLRVTSASSNFIGLQQDFDPPLIFGYLGFDVVIREDGSIGAPIPTHAILDPIGGENPDTSLVVEALFPKYLPNNIYDELTNADNEIEDKELRQRASLARQHLDALGVAFVPMGIPKPVYYETDYEGNVTVKSKESISQDYKGFKAYIALLSTASGPLDMALKKRKDFILVTYSEKNKKRDKETVVVDSQQWKDLEQLVMQRSKQRDAIENAAETISVVRSAGDVYIRMQIAKIKSMQ